MKPHRPDPSLPAAALRGESGAREALLDAWLPVVIQWADRLGGPRTDAEDVAQDVFLVVLRRLADVRDLEGFPAWLYGITRKTVAAHRRRAWFRRWVPGAAPERASSAPSPEEDVEAARRARKVQALLEELPTAQREVLVLCDVEGRTAVEAAGLIGIPVGTVRSRLRLGRTRFRQLAEAIHLTPMERSEVLP